MARISRAGLKFDKLAAMIGKAEKLSTPLPTKACLVFSGLISGHNKKVIPCHLFLIQGTCVKKARLGL